MTFDPAQFVSSATVSPSDVTPGSLRDPSFIPGYIPHADRYLERLKAEIPWKDKWWNLLYKLPQQAYHYTISEREKKPNTVLEELIWIVENLHNAKASEVWCNLFRNGDDHIAYHQDQYHEHLTTLSFGSTRSFLMRHLKSGLVSEFRLRHGDVYTWSPETDRHFQHSIPAARGVEGVRISIVIWTAKPGSGR